MMRDSSVLEKSGSRAFWAVLFLCLITLGQALPARAEVFYESPETGYRVILEDDAELLDEEQEASLAEAMEEITAYGNAALKTVSENSYATDVFAENYYRQVFGTDSGTVFVIDMDNREIFIFSDGELYRVVTTNYAYTITDNAYRYASDSDYYNCALTVFGQELSLLKGQRIAQPMKYVCNAFFAVVLALMFNYFLMVGNSKPRKAGEKEMLSSLGVSQELLNAKAIHTTTTRTYSPVQSSSGGSSGGGGSRSSGGGGHSSGGGGGHRF